MNTRSRQTQEPLEACAGKRKRDVETMVSEPNHAPRRGFPFGGHVTYLRGFPFWQSKQSRGFPFHCLRPLYARKPKSEGSSKKSTRDTVPAVRYAGVPTSAPPPPTFELALGVEGYG